MPSAAGHNRSRINFAGRSRVNFAGHNRSRINFAGRSRVNFAWRTNRSLVLEGWDHPINGELQGLPGRVDRHTTNQRV